MKNNKKVLDAGILFLVLLLAFVVYAAPPSLISPVTPANNTNTSALLVNISCDFSDPEGDNFNTVFLEVDVDRDTQFYNGTCGTNGWYCNPNATFDEGSFPSALGVSTGVAEAVGNWQDAQASASFPFVCEFGETGNFYVNSSLANWAGANISCTSLNGSIGWRLALISDSEEQDEVAQLCDPFGQNYCWTAGFGVAVTNFFWSAEVVENITLQNTTQSFYQWETPDEKAYNWACYAVDNNGEHSISYQQLFNNQFIEINFTFLDEIKNYAWAGVNISSELIPLDPDNRGFNQNTSSATASFSNLTEGTYIMIYDSNQSIQRGFVFDAGLDTNNLTVYMLNNTLNSNQVEINVVSNINEPIRNAVVKTYKFSADIADYKLVESTKTNFEGKTTQTLILDKLYRMTIEYPIGNTIFVSEPDILFSNTINLVVNTVEDGTSNFFEYQNLTYILNFTNATNTFLYSFVGSSNVDQGCLKIYQLTSDGQELKNSSCANSNLGLIQLTINPANETTWIAKGYVSIDGQEYLVNSISKIFGVGNIGGKTGLLMIILLTVALASIFFISATIALIVAPLPLVVASLVKFIPIPVPIALSTYVVFIILAIVVGRRN